MNSAQNKLAKAKSAIILSDPFFACLMFKLQWQEDPTCKTAWTDGVRLGYNPEFIDGLTLEQTKGLIVHEIGHCVSKHPMRRGERDPKRWNMAADYVVNQIVTGAGYKLPDGALLDSHYGEKSTEEAYNMLPWPEDGQGQDGNPDPGGCGEVRDAPKGDSKGQGEGLNGTEGGQGKPEPQSSEELAADWDQAVVQAAEAAKTCGKSLGPDLARLVGDIKDPKQPWKEVLARFLEEVSYNDYDWSVPDRRFLNSHIILPSLHSKTFGDLAVAVDVSGSISQEDVKAMLAEVFGILATFEESGKEEVSIPVVYCSNRVHDHEILSLGQEPTPVGTGGTAYAPAIAYVNERWPDIKALIYLTDGRCSSFGDQPEYDLLWGICFDGVDRFDPPFGDVLYMARS